MSIKSIEDLNVWQESRKFCGSLYDLIKKLPPEEKYNIAKHLRENARGIPANIAEGFYRFHYKDSIRFYLIARGCLGEIKSDLYISLDQHYFDQGELTEAFQHLEKVMIMLNGLIKSINLYKKNNS